MGKGRILENHGEGRYIIEIVEDRARAESARAIAVSRVQNLDQRISGLEAEVGTLQATVDEAALAQDQAIDEHQQQLAETGASDVDLPAFAQALFAAAAQRDRVRGEARQLRVERMAIQGRINRIDALPPLRQVEAWCADLTEDLAGDVATAEAPGEIGQVLIRPGYVGEETSGWPSEIQGGAEWVAARDGAIQPALSSTPAGVFYNLSLLPGWQKWRPTFRIATITSVNGDLCNITLDPAASSQQGLAVNAQASYSGVPIYYMDCNGFVFEEGDRVLVAFSGNTGKPMVVGFESQPKGCGFGFYTRERPEFFSANEQFTTATFGVAIAFQALRNTSVRSVIRQAGPNTSDGASAVVLCEMAGLEVGPVLFYHWLDSTTGGVMIGSLHEFTLPPGDVVLEEGVHYALIALDVGAFGGIYSGHFLKEIFFDYYSAIEPSFSQHGNQSLVLRYDVGAANPFTDRPSPGDDLADVMEGHLLEVSSASNDPGLMTGLGLNHG